MNEKFEEWAIVELFGHQRIAGRVTEQTIGGCSFVRVDSPATPNAPAFTKLYGQGAIYAITLASEEIATAAAERIAPIPFDRFEMRELKAIADRNFSREQDEREGDLYGDETMRTTI
jgi:hypothetical protein